MNDPLRAFVAIDAAPALADSPPWHALTTRLAPLAPDVKTVRLEHCHLTLRFLGNIDVDQRAAIENILGEIASRFPACDLPLRGLGAFPSAHRPRILGLGCPHAGPLLDLVHDLNRRLDALSLKPVDRPWTPHLTVARIRQRPPGRLAAILQQFHDTDFGVLPVREIRLVRSVLQPTGPRYSVLARAALV